MNASPAPIASRPLDLMLLGIGFTLWLAGLLLVWRMPAWAAACYLMLLELLFLAWSAAGSSGRRGAAVALAMKTQRTLACRVGVTVIITCTLTSLVYYLFNFISPDPKLARVLNDPATWRTAAAGLAMAVLSIPFVTMWYLQALQARGLAFADLAGEAFLRSSLHMASPAAKVQPRLDFYLRALASPLSAPLPTIMYGVRPSMSSLASEDGKAIYECKWTWLPAKLVIEVSAEGPDAARVDVRCLLRGGIYGYDLAVLPNEALMLLDHVRLHVLEPLRNDMAQQESERRQETLRLQAMEMRLKVLQAQVEPHFLFNTMANVRQLYRLDVPAGENLLNNLISYLRGAMDGLRADQSTVGAELALVRHFLAIMKVRMGSRLSYTLVNFDELDALPFPPAMLISLVENAIKHGLQHKENGQLRITAARDNGKLSVSVIDNGTGFAGTAGTGVGLSNIRQRLEAMYGHGAWLEAGARPDGGFVSTIVVPA